MSICALRYKLQLNDLSYLSPDFVPSFVYISETMVESALSPPYDGSEYDELFPELTGVEPEEMVDIESLANSALDSVLVNDELPAVPKKSMIRMMSDDASTYSQAESTSDILSDSGSVVSDSERDYAESEEDDNLLRYLIGETGEMKRPGAGRKRRPSSPDSGSFSENSNNVSKTKGKTQSIGVTRKVKPSKTTVTVVDHDGVRKTVKGPNRNAVMAKLNRERKKQIMTDLEKKVGLLGTENDALKKQNVRLRKKTGILERELQYVKEVLANQSALAGLLKNIKATGLDFHSSMRVPSVPQSRNEVDIDDTDRKRRRLGDHDYCLHQSSSSTSTEIVPESEDVTIPARSTSEGAGSGVCLHVSDGSVSLEFCSKCSLKAKAAQSARKRKGSR